MSNSEHVGNYEVRSIANGFIVSSGVDLRRGGVPIEHYASSVDAVGEYIAEAVSKKLARRHQDDLG